MSAADSIALAVVIVVGFCAFVALVWFTMRALDGSWWNRAMMFFVWIAVIAFVIYFGNQPL